MLESKKIGLLLLQNKRISLLKIGTTLTILHIFGNTSVMNDLFVRVDKGMENVPWISFKIFVRMLFGSKLLLFLNVFLRSDISLGVVAKYKMYLSLYII